MSSILIPWGVSTTHYVVLVNRLSGQHQVNPTIASGDFQFSKDESALANLGTLPSVAPASSKQVRLVISATEAECTRLMVYGADAAGAEWDDDGWVFHTVLGEGGLAGKITSGTPTTTSFVSSQLTGAQTDHYKDVWIRFLTGACAGAICKVTAFNASTDEVTHTGLPTTPSVGDVWEAML